MMNGRASIASHTSASMYGGFCFKNRNGVKDVAIRTTFNRLVPPNISSASVARLRAEARLFSWCSLVFSVSLNSLSPHTYVLTRIQSGLRLHTWSFDDLPTHALRWFLVSPLPQFMHSSLAHLLEPSHQEYIRILRGATRLGFVYMMTRTHFNYMRFITLMLVIP